MPYAAKAIINHVFDTDHLNVYVTFRSRMRQIEDELPLTPPLAKWLLEADEVNVNIISSAWLDEWTLFLTSDIVALEPTGVTLEYAGPDAGLKTAWDKQWEPWGAIPSYAGYPTTPALHNSTHENGGSDEIQVDGLSGLLADTQHSFVDRGDPAAWDFTKADFITDDTWRDLNLSTIIPAGAKAAYLRVYITATTVNRYLVFRKKGNTNSIAGPGCRTPAANISDDKAFTVALDTNQICQYLGSTIAFTNIYIVVLGWFL